MKVTDDGLELLGKVRKMLTQLENEIEDDKYFDMVQEADHLLWKIEAKGEAEREAM